MVFLVLIIVLALISYPYILTAVACHKMLKKLRRIAKREAYDIIPLRRFWWLPNGLGGKYDFLLEGRGETVAVKLWTSFKKGSVLVISPDGTAALRSVVNEPMNINGRSAKKTDRLGKPVKIAEMTENWNAPESKSIERAFLVYPPFGDIRFNDGREEIALRYGDSVFEKKIYEPYNLEQKMKISGKALSSGRATNT